MTQFSETHLPCDDCGSSDALAVYKDSGVSICFSCGMTKPPDGVAMTTWAVRPSIQSIPSRSLTEETCQRYGYGVATMGTETVQLAPYYVDGKVVAQKIRTKDKNFKIIGDGSKMGLFGQQLASGKGKMVVITEGEIDALSVSQALGNTWPVLSLPNGASSLKPFVQALELLEGYDRVVICFDSDEPGKAAAEAALSMLSPGKGYRVNLGIHKDANEMLVKEGAAVLRRAIWDAQEYRPDGVVSMRELFDAASKPLERGTSYPWPKLDGMLYGFRPGELITWTAGTGTGKTQVMSELEHHLLLSGSRVGIIHLEEGCVRTARRLVGIHLDKPLHLPDSQVDDAEFKEAWDELFTSENAFSYDHFGSVDSDVLLSRIRYMRHCYKVNVVVLDHVSIVVSGADLDVDERRMLDRTMTLLKSLCEETGLTIHVVSHLRRPPGTHSHEEGMAVSLSHLRGTQAISQLSDAVIALERNQQAEDPLERNTTSLRVLKNRYAGLTGTADSLSFDPETGRMTPVGLFTTEDF